jgi:hypothetical protein
MMACIHFETETKVIQAINSVTHVQKGDKPNQVKLIDKEGNALLVIEKVHL